MIFFSMYSMYNVSIYINRFKHLSSIDEIVPTRVSKTDIQDICRYPSQDSLAINADLKSVTKSALLNLALLFQKSHYCGIFHQNLFWQKTSFWQRLNFGFNSPGVLLTNQGGCGDHDDLTSIM